MKLLLFVDPYDKMSNRLQVKFNNMSPRVSAEGLIAREEGWRVLRHQRPIIDTEEEAGLTSITDERLYSLPELPRRAIIWLTGASIGRNRLTVNSQYSEGVLALLYELLPREVENDKTKPVILDRESETVIYDPRVAKALGKKKLSPSVTGLVSLSGSKQYVTCLPDNRMAVQAALYRELPYKEDVDSATFK